MKSDKDLVESLQTAARAIEEADLPKDLQQPAFEKLLESLLSDGPRDATTQLPSRPDGISSSPSDAMEDAARRLKVDPGLLERIIDFDEDGAHIVASRSQFSAKKSRAIQEVALLVAGARQGGGVEDWTSLSVIREACMDLGVDDRSNFATHIKSLAGARQRRSGRTGEIKLNSVGFEHASALVHSIAEKSK